MYALATDLLYPAGLLAGLPELEEFIGHMFSKMQLCEPSTLLNTVSAFLIHFPFFLQMLQGFDLTLYTWEAQYQNLSLCLS